MLYDIFNPLSMISLQRGDSVETPRRSQGECHALCLLKQPIISDAHAAGASTYNDTGNDFPITTFQWCQIQPLYSMYIYYIIMT